ncbi:hypothetical protein ACFE04_004240 [Oxalis oulophora]
MVKKHSTTLLGKEKNAVDDDDEREDAGDMGMDGGFWHDVFDLYFIRALESRSRQDDDMIFFVRKMGSQRDAVDDRGEDNSPYFVRRWAPELDKLIGESSAEVDWRRSFYLNMIAHTSFSVTVAICSHQVLQKHQPGKDTSLSPIYKVVKTVYASPSRVNFHLDAKKASEVETTPAYPDICFAVDDFDSTFDAVVLTEEDHCYCVLLNAHDGAAFPSEKQTSGGSSSNSGPPPRIDTVVTNNSKDLLAIKWCGVVMMINNEGKNYKLINRASGKSRFGGLLSIGHSPGKTDRIYMKGPGGRGEVEVAVSGVVDQSQIDSGPFSPVASKKGFGLGSIVRKAASVATVAAKQAYAAASSNTTADDEMIPLKCCLISISLPWHHIAHDLLFKGTPPVKI